MTNTIPDSHRDLLDGPVYVTVATVMPDGQPQMTIVWANYDGTFVKINTARGRQKDKNLIARPQATLLALDPNDGFRWLEVRGVVAERTEEGAVAHIDELCRLYTGKSSYYGDYQPAEKRHQETRVIFKIRPFRVNAFGH
jgi:PPOX class probable F420-dependent enzyme